MNSYQVRMVMHEDGSPGRTFVIENVDDRAYFRLNSSGLERAEQWLEAKLEKKSN